MSLVEVCTTKSLLRSLLIPIAQGAKKALLMLSRIALLLSPKTFERSIGSENFILTSRRRWAVGLISWIGSTRGKVEAEVLL